MRVTLRYLFCGLILLFVSSMASAQAVLKSSDSVAKTKPVVQQHTLVYRPKKPKQINTEFSMGIRVNTNGWSVFTDYGKSNVVDNKHADRFYHVKLFQFEISEKKSPREMRSSSGSASSTGSSDSYIFGKVNNFYAIKLGYGYRKMIAGKPDNQGAVSIHWVNTGGLSIGVLKPYYLNIEGGSGAIKYADNRTEFLDPGQIMSSAGFGKGLGEAKFIPGVHFKTGFHFDFSGNLKSVIAIETGFNAEYYSQDISLMANSSATPYFVDAYLSFQFGKRW